MEAHTVNCKCIGSSLTQSKSARMDLTIDENHLAIRITSLQLSGRSMSS